MQKLLILFQACRFMKRSNYFLLVLLWALSTVGFSQQREDFRPSGKGNIALQWHYNQHRHSNEKVNLIVHGQKREIARWVIERGGQVKYSFRNTINCWLPVAQVRTFTKLSAVDYIEFSSGQGIILTDQTVINTRSHLARQGLAPLHKGYTGKGVIVGIIDTGIDFAHPDFQDSLGNTRILAIWDQTLPQDPVLTPQKFGYGQAWDSTAINAGNCVHDDPISYFGHGTNVSGVAAGNGLSVPDSIADYRGIAPDAYIVAVATNFAAGNWTATVADAAKYIFDLGDSLGLPVVLNASLGQLTGSHDGLDTPAQLIDSMLKAKPGRAMVCAAGNFGQYDPYHVQLAPNGGTTFSLFKTNPNSAFGSNAVFYEGWLDSASAQNLQFSFDLTDTTAFIEIDRTPTFSLPFRYFSTATDSLFDSAGTFITEVFSYAEPQGSRVLFQVYINNPSQEYYYGLHAAGIGTLDIWSSENFRWSRILSQGLPSPAQQSRMVNYAFPDSLQSIVSSWACSPNVITVGNYINRNSYIDVDSTLQTFPLVAGQRAASSSRGPSRLGILKPDLMAPGDITLSTGKIQDLNAVKNVPSLRSFIGLGGWHRRTSGTSMASPAVAGIVALMLEKCPTLSNQDILNQLYSNTFQDSLTGTSLPNIEWGRGKVDAFQSLLESNFSVQVIPTSDSLVCPQEPARISVAGSYNEYHWSNGDSSSVGSFSSPGPVVVTVTNTKGCKAVSDSFQVKAASLPPVSVDLGADTTICASDTLTLTISPKGLPFSWFNSQVNDSSISVVGEEKVWVAITNTEGCTFSDTIRFQLEKGPGFSLMEDTAFCEGDTFYVSGIFPSAQYTWLDAEPSLLRKIYQQGSYVLIGEDSIGCLAFDTLQVQKNSLPLFSLGQDTGLCLGQRSQMTLQGPLGMQQYVWSSGQSSASLTVCDSLVSGCDVTVTQLDTLSLWVRDPKGCSYIDSILINRVAPPSVELVEDTAFCANSSFLLPLQNGGDPLAHWQWNTGETTPLITTQTFGWISLLGTDKWGCTNSDSVVIDSLPVPRFSLGGDTLVVNGKDITVLGPSGVGHYLWNTGDTTSSLQFFLGDKTDSLIWLTVENQEGCTFSDSLFLEFVVGVTEEGLPEASMYPNPVANNIRVSGTKGQFYRVLVYSMDGKKIVDRVLQSNDVDVSHLATGTYWVQVWQDEKLLVQQKLIKTHHR